MVVMVTGAGLVGRHIAAALAGMNKDVVVLDRRAPPVGKLPPTAQFRNGDITDVGFMRQTIRDFGVTEVIHTAALLAVSARERPDLAVTTNILGAVHLLEFAREGLLRRVVLASSGSINQAAYGRAPRSGIVEDFESRVLSEGPVSFYIATKLSMEYFCQLYRQSFDVSAVALRLGAVMGAAGWDDASLIARLGLSVVEAAKAGSILAITDQRLLWENSEEFLDPRDAADGMIAALLADDLPQAVYNIASPQSVSYGEFLAEARGAFPGLVTDVPVQPHGGLINFPHPRSAPTDISAARRDLDFSPRYTLRDSLRYMQQQLCKTENRVTASGLQTGP